MKDTGNGSHAWTGSRRMPSDRTTALRDRDVVDVASELAYWRNRFTTGALIADSFHKDCGPVIRIACDIYVRSPHDTRSVWLLDLDARLSSDTNSRQRKVYSQIAELCWNRLLS